MAERKQKNIPEWARRLREALAARNWSVVDLARAMDREDDKALLDSLYKYVAGKVKQPRGDVMEQVAAALGISVIALMHGPLAAATASSAFRIRCIGRVAANNWRDVGQSDQTEAHEQRESIIPPDPRYPPSAQYELLVVGNSINRVAPDGFLLRVVDVRKAGVAASPGDLVIAERRRDGGQLIETTAKRLRQGTKGEELWPESTDPQWQHPLKLGENTERAEEVEIIGLVLYCYLPTPRT
jgi:transcriptional regulator with XRE-family HTH domain